jgi:hypothetical protein
MTLEGVTCSWQVLAVGPLAVQVVETATCPCNTLYMPTHNVLRRRLHIGVPRPHVHDSAQADDVGQDH